jgi:hypothetical protein
MLVSIAFIQIFASPVASSQMQWTFTDAALETLPSRLTLVRFRNRFDRDCHPRIRGQGTGSSSSNMPSTTVPPIRAIMFLLHSSKLPPHHAEIGIRISATNFVVQARFGQPVAYPVLKVEFLVLPRLALDQLAVTDCRHALPENLDDCCILRHDNNLR